MKRWNETSAMLNRRLLALVFVFLGALPVAARAAAAAMISDLLGKAIVTSGGKSYEARILTEIEPGTQLQLLPGATLVVLYLEGGDEYAFKGPALIVFGMTQPAMINGAPPEKRGASLGKGIRIKPVGLAQGATVLRASPGTAHIRLLSLSGTRVLETQPEFRWQAIQPGVKYQIEIADETGRLMYEAQIDSTVFRLPAGMQFKEGMAYTWEVSTRLPDGQKNSSAGVFGIADTELRVQAAAVRPDPSAPVSARVAYAVWLDQVELKDEARRYWRVLSAERPDDARLKGLAEP